MKCPCCGYLNLPGADVCEHCLNSLTLDDVLQPKNAIERGLMQNPIVVLEPVIPITVNQVMPLKEVVTIMRKHKIGCVLVTGTTGSLVGILTERDFLRKVAVKSLNLAQIPVANVMSPAPECSKPEHPLAFALQRMIISDIRYLPLVDNSEQPTGIISSRDIIDYVVRQMSILSNH